MSSIRGMLLKSKSTQNENTVIVGLEAIDSNAAVLETEQQDRAIAAMGVDIDRLNDIHTGLESLCENATATLDDGGMDRPCANMLTAGANAILAPLEMTAPCPGVESFGGIGERMGSTRVAVESIGSVMSDIWQAIKKAIEDMRKKIIAWYKGIFNTATKIKNRAQKIIDEAGKKTGGKKSDADDFEFKTQACSTGDGQNVKATMVDFSGQASDLLIRNATQLETITGELVTGYNDVACGTEDEIKAAAISVASGLWKSNGKITALLGTGGVAATAVKNKALALDEESGASYKFGKELPGNRVLAALELSIPEPATADVDNAAKIISHAGRMGVKVVVLDEEAEKDADAISMDVPSIAEIEDIANACMDIAETIGKFQAGSKKLDKAKDKVLKAGSDFEKKASKTKVTGASNGLNKLQKLPASMVKLLDQPANSLVKMYVGSANTALNFCQAALKQYK